MKLILAEQHEQMLANFQNEDQDHAPVVKLFCPWNAATWLLTEMNPHNEDVLFGLCDLGQGLPELGYVSMTSIMEVTGPGGLKIERDRFFKPVASLSVYARAARVAGNIVENEGSLLMAYHWLAESARDEKKPLRARHFNIDDGQPISFPVFAGLGRVTNEEMAK